MSFQLITPGAGEAITLQEAKDHLRVTNTVENTLITSLIVNAREIAEFHMRKAVISSTWDLRLDILSEIIHINKTPVTSVTDVFYFDTDDVEQTLDAADFRIDLNTKPARIEIITPPTVKIRIDAVRIRFVAGFADAAAVPQDIKQAMLNIIADFYENRQNISGVQLFNIPYDSQQIFDNNKIFEF